MPTSLNVSASSRNNASNALCQSALVHPGRSAFSFVFSSTRAVVVVVVVAFLYSKAPLACSVISRKVSFRRRRFFSSSLSSTVLLLMREICLSLPLLYFCGRNSFVPSFHFHLGFPIVGFQKKRDEGSVIFDRTKMSVSIVPL